MATTPSTAQRSSSVDRSYEDHRKLRRCIDGLVSLAGGTHLISEAKPSLGRKDQERIGAGLCCRCSLRGHDATSVSRNAGNDLDPITDRSLHELEHLEPLSGGEQRSLTSVTVDD